MSRLFLSHSSADNFEARALAEWLAEEGWSDVFLDIDPERGIAAGQRWERALHKAADRCEAVVFLISRAWLASGWCRKEYELARRLSKQLFAVIVERGMTLADLPPELTDTWQVTDLAGGDGHRMFAARLPGSDEERHVLFSRAGLDRLRAGLKQAGLDPREFPWPPEGAKDPAPYVGLRALTGDEAGLFFGRDADLVRALDRLRGLSEAAAPRVAVILGASGAGKSSFLRAGLLPRLARDDARFLVLPAIRPARDPLDGEAGLISALDVAVETPHPRADVSAAVARGAEGVREWLAPLVAAAAARTLGPRRPTVVVSVDQAEELFSADGDGPKLLGLLADLVRDDAPAVLLLFSIRSDAYDALERAKPLEGMAQETLPLLPMPRHAARAVIEGPAARYAAHVGKLAAADPGNAVAQDDVSDGLERLGDAKLQTGDQAAALAAYKESLAIHRKLAAADLGNARAQRNASVSLEKLGEVKLQAGDQAGALAVYQENLAIHRKLAAADPGNAQAQRDVSVILERLGDVKLQAGDLAGALAAQQESLDIHRKLASSDPGNAQAQRDATISLNKFGEVKLEAGDPAGALAAYRESLDIRRKLAAADASNAQAQRDVGASLNNLGDVKLRAGDPAGALAGYQESLAILRKLAAADPGNAQAQRDLSVSLDKLGDVKLRAGDPASALAAYQESLDIRRKLAAADSGNAEAQRDVSVGLNKLGDAKRQGGDPAGALAAYQESLDICRKLAALDAGNVVAQTDVVVSLYHLAQAGDAAVSRLREALDILDSLEKAGRLLPDKKTWRGILENALKSATAK